MDGSERRAPYYRSVGREREVFRTAARERLPVLLKGPTGCGKSRLVEAMAHELGRPLVTVACNDETSAADLLGRYLVRGAETVWQDGPATRAVRSGAILYLDELAEAREDVLVVLHPLADHRRELFLDRRDEQISAADGFQLVASFNPGYRRGPKDLKPSTRQRFVAIALGYPEAEAEIEIVSTETGVERGVAKRLVSLASKIRSLTEAGLTETASTRLLVAAARLIGAGVPPRVACRAAIVEPLTDDHATARALGDLCDLGF
ncbi:MAG: CbbQ/NirQ/NorQ/GpvN family protein [Deltaproteobacteria bacterium]|jgi:nitric oxide reductase NorQ protein|nr:CbbQ/NirQ/NorQ/GpvN family protein [Deltaproteobacteria bacterium]